MADRAVNFFTNKGIKRRTHGQRQTVTESEICHHQADQAVNRPDMKAPVEECNLHGLFRRIHRLRSAHWRLGIMQHGFGHTEEQQRDAITRRKQHGEPFRKRILRLAMVWPQLDVAPGGQADTDDKDKEQRHHQHIEPAEVNGDPGLGSRKRLPRQLRITDGANNQ